MKRFVLPVVLLWLNKCQMSMSNSIVVVILVYLFVFCLFLRILLTYNDGLALKYRSIYS